MCTRHLCCVAANNWVGGEASQMLSMFAAHHSIIITYHQLQSCSFFVRLCSQATLDMHIAFEHGSVPATAVPDAMTTNDLFTDVSAQFPSGGYAGWRTE